MAVRVKSQSISARLLSPVAIAFVFACPALAQDQPKISSPEPPPAKAQTRQEDTFEQGTIALNSLSPGLAITCFSRTSRRYLKGALNEPARAHRAACCYLQIGRAFESDENQPAANQAYAMAHKLDKDDITIIAYLANGLAKTYRDQEAAPLYAILNGRRGTNLSALAALALYEHRRYNFVAAQKLLAAAIEQEPAKSCGQIHYLLARTLQRQGLTVEAARVYETASQKTSDRYQSLITLGIKEQLLNERKSQEAHTREAGRIHPDDPAWHTELGIMLSATAEGTQPGLDELIAAVQCKRVLAKSFVVLANSLNHHERKAEAIRCLDYLKRLKPWSADVPHAQAGIYKANNENKRAEEYYLKALRLNPRSGVFMTDLASLYAEEKRFDKAFEYLARAVTINPLYTPAWRRLGLMAVALDDWSAAKDYYTRALALTPGSNKLENLNDLVRNEVALNHARIGTFFFKGGDMPRTLAEAKMFNALKFNPSLPAYLTIVKIRPGRLSFQSKFEKERRINEFIAIADMLHETRQLDDSIKFYRKAIELNPEDIDIHSYLLEVLSDAGQWAAWAQEDVLISTQVVNRVPRAIDQWTGRGGKKPPQSQDTKPEDKQAN